MRDPPRNRQVKRALLLAALAGFAAARATAQVDAEIALEREALLLYEPIRVLVQLTNLSPKPLDLARAAPEKPWLEIFVARADDTAVPRTAKPWSPPAALLLPGRKRILETDILPAFQIREPGDYRIHVRVNDHGRPAAARTLKLSVERGTTLRQQQALLPPAETSADSRTRLYTLLLHRQGETRELFVRVEDPQQERVFGAFRLGPWVNSADLETKVDREGSLHVLQRAGARVFRYSRVMPNGKIQPQRVFSNIGSPPHLAILGNDAIEVVGGEEIVLEKGKPEGLIPTAPLASPPRSPPSPSPKGNGF